MIDYVRRTDQNQYMKKVDLGSQFVVRQLTRVQREGEDDPEDLGGTKLTRRRRRNHGDRTLRKRRSRNRWFSERRRRRP